MVGVCIGDPNFKYFCQFIGYGGVQLIFMGISNSRFNNAILVKEEQDRRKSMQMIALGVSYVFGVLLLVMSLSFFYQAIYPDITRNEEKY